MAKDYGLKITETGYDVSSANIENVIFSSAYPFFKVYSDSSSTLTIPYHDTKETLTFSHSLGYVPAFILYTTASSIDSYHRMIPRGVSPHPIYGVAYSTSSDVVLVMATDGNQDEFSIDVRCIIFKDKIAS